MNKTATPEYFRLYLIECLPEPLTPASAHIQIFDNYIEGTRLRIRLVRDPGTKDWTRILQQRIATESNDRETAKLAEIYLNETEYSLFEQFEGHEIRKNRYFHEFDRLSFKFDVYLGDLWGLNTARVDFDSASAMNEFEPPPFVVFEVTNNGFFFGPNLVGKKFDDVRAEVEKVGSRMPTAAPAIPDE
jgi:CYTH domain-containing protein